MPSQSTSILSVKNLSKSYGKGEGLFYALADINLDIKQGETIAIIGKSGSGKSTLMHLLAMLDKPTTGSVSIESRDAATIRGRELDKLRNKTFGFVFQQFFLNANSSVLDNTILPLKIAGVGSGERKKRGLEVLADVELENKANQKAKDLSGGQKQRAVIARALVNTPQVIFADEPTGNLDSATGKKIEEMLFKLNKDKGITLIIVTHDDDLARLCDRQINLIDGKIVGGEQK